MLLSLLVHGGQGEGRVCLQVLLRPGSSFRTPAGLINLQPGSIHLQDSPTCGLDLYTCRPHQLEAWISTPAGLTNLRLGSLHLQASPTCGLDPHAVHLQASPTCGLDRYTCRPHQLATWILMLYTCRPHKPAAHAGTQGMQGIVETHIESSKDPYRE